MTPEDLAELAQRLEEIYGRPPAGNAPVLDELVRSIISQSTTDRQRDEVYAALRARYPTWEAVRLAGEDAVAAVIGPAGLGRQKAARIKRALDALAGQDLARLGTAEAFERLVALPGVGPKTAACVLLFALDRPIFPVDTHILRVCRRLGLAGARTGATVLQREINAAVPPGAVLSLHVNLIRHSRQVCRARRPRCGSCPLAGRCPTSRHS